MAWKQELTTERIMAEADLNKQLGTVRYLRGLRAARQRMQAATTRTDQASGQQGELGAGTCEGNPADHGAESARYAGPQVRNGAG